MMHDDEKDEWYRATARSHFPPVRRTTKKGQKKTKLSFEEPDRTGNEFYCPSSASK
jgi:hypothetical protein